MGARRSGSRSADERCGEASGHRERWRADFGLLPTLGANAYRFSIERSAVEPEPGVLLRRGAAASSASAWTSSRGWASSRSSRSTTTRIRAGSGRRAAGRTRRSVAGFRRYAAVVAGRARAARADLGHAERADRVPARRLPRRPDPAGPTELRGARRGPSSTCSARTPRPPTRSGARPPAAASASRTTCWSSRRTGADSSLDRRLARHGERLYNLRAARSDRDRRRATGRFRARAARAFRVPDLPAANDFVGVNYYSRVHIRFRGAPGAVGEFFYRDPEARGLTDMGWEIHPARLRPGPAAGGDGGPARSSSPRTASPRATTGCAATFCGSTPWCSRTGARRARRIDGYFHWSLLDNFEWLEGFRPRFGLFEVDYATFARRRRPSADLFARARARSSRREAGGETFRRLPK